VCSADLICLPARRGGPALPDGRRAQAGRSAVRSRAEPGFGFGRALVLSPSADGLGEAAGQPKKMEATCLIDHKWRYNEDLSTPPFDRLRVVHSTLLRTLSASRSVSVVEPQSSGCLVLGPPPGGLAPSTDALGGSA
jgi:hypothetical protein